MLPAGFGLRTGWSGRVGDDDAGTEFLAAFETFNVKVEAAQILPNRLTDLCIVMVEPSGERSLMIVPTIEDLPELSLDVKGLLMASRFAYTVPYEVGWFKEFAKAVHDGGGQVVVDVEASNPFAG